MPAVPATRPMMESPMSMPQMPMLPMESMQMMESPIYPSQGPAMMPQFNPMPDGWQMLESPAITEMESPDMGMLSAPCPPEQGYIPQAVPPMMQGGWSPIQPGFPMMPMGSHQHDCGCGCSGGCGCGCKDKQPMMVLPMHWGMHPCQCHYPQHMQPVPYHMMPNQGFSGYGAY